MRLDSSSRWSWTSRSGSKSFRPIKGRGCRRSPRRPTNPGFQTFCPCPMATLAGVTGAQDASSAEGGSAAARGPLESPRTTRFNMPGVSPTFPSYGIFGPGFQLKSKDEEFELQIHDLTQVDGRFYTQGQQTPVTSTFLIPRQWLIFSGRLTKPFEYYVSVAEGIDNLNILDVFMNVNFDPRLQFKIGRFKTPFTYEFYDLPINGFPTPERSLFFNNFGLNRDIGMMAWGQMFDNRFDYAAAIVNGTRNGYVDTNDFKDFAGLINFRPFANRTDHWLENFNIGGSTDTGLEQATPVPQVFRTNVATTGNLAIGPEFLAAQQERERVGAACVLVDAHGVLLPTPLVDFRVAERVRQLRAGQPVLPDSRAGRELLRDGRLFLDRRDGE